MLKEAVCSFISTFVSSFIDITVEKVCQIYKKYIPLYIAYTFHLSLNHANFVQFKVKTGSF